MQGGKLMTKRIRILLAGAAVLAMMLVLGGCGSKDESGVYTGTLAEALENKIVLATDDGTQEFSTDGDTVYELGDMDQLSINDAVDVDYHGSNGNLHADKVILREHIEKERTFAGIVTEVTDEHITVTGKSLTVSFVRNGDSVIEGHLSVGDGVELVYTGDLNEYPFATRVIVTSEKTEPEKKTISGIVSEFTETSVLIAIDSAKSYRFTLDKNTTITGVAKHLRIGDSVNVTFEGDLGKTPTALNVNIVKETQEPIRTVNGTIETVAKNYLVLNTGRKTYIIQTDKNTKYTGDKPDKGYKSEITYTGNLSSKAVATNVFCVKQTPEPTFHNVSFMDGFGNTIITVKVEDGKTAPAPAAPKHDGYVFQGWDKSFAKVTADMTVTATWVKVEPEKEEQKEDQKQDETQPEGETTPEEDIVIEAEGKIIEGDEANMTCKIEIDGNEVEFTVTSDTAISPGYFPQKEDTVLITYSKSDMKLLDITLLNRPEPAESGEQAETSAKTDE